MMVHVRSLRFCVSTFVVLLLHAPIGFVSGEETGYSIENNRVLKLLAEADAARRTTTQSPSATAAAESPPMLPSNFSHAEYERIVREVRQLKSVIIRMQQMSQLDEQIQKCIASIKRNIDYKAKQHWRNIVYELMHFYENADSDTMNNEVGNDLQSQDEEDGTQQAIEQEKSAVLRRIVIGSYEGLRSNILPIVHFINFTKIISGFHPLLQEMRDYDHIYYGNEVFLIARLIRLWCGAESKLYEELPVGIQYIDSYSVHLLNENNQGLLFYKPKTPCRGRHCNNHEMFTYHHSVHDFGQEETDKATWTFLPTNTTDAVWNTKLEFYMKNGFLEPINVTAGIGVGNASTNASQPQYKYVDIDYEYKLSPIKKSTVIVNLVNHTEDAVRIRVVQTHLVKRLIMGTKNPGRSSLAALSIMGTEDRFETANDGNWVVLPVQKLNATMLKDKSLWNKNVQCSID